MIRKRLGEFQQTLPPEPPPLAAFQIADRIMSRPLIGATGRR